jgi:prepilin-type N-terminal cleavage/methylation domain-containing protein
MKRIGFTLIELIFVMVVTAILANMAFTKFYIYKKNAFDSFATSDLRNAANAQEGHFVNHEIYQTCVNNGCVSGANAIEGLQGINSGTTLVMTGGSSAFYGTAIHDNGSGKTFIYDSANGGLQP